MLKILISVYHLKVLIQYLESRNLFLLPPVIMMQSDLDITASRECQYGHFFFLFFFFNIKLSALTLTSWVIHPLPPFIPHAHIHVH